MITIINFHTHIDTQWEFHAISNTHPTLVLTSLYTYLPT
jgi:hypothetical protein